MSDDSFAAVLSRLRACHSAKHGTTVVDPSVSQPMAGTRAAAVLVGLFEGPGGEVRVLLTQRSGKLRHHAGEVALPGGKHDATDPHLVFTAMREANEEVGLPYSSATPVAVLDPAVSKHGLLVTPVVATIPSDFEAKATASAAEVAAVFSCPLTTFLESANHSHKDIVYGVHPFRIHFFDYTDPASGDSYMVWGMTAHLMVGIAQAALGREPEFDPQCPDGPDRTVVIRDRLKQVRQAAAARAHSDASGRVEAATTSAQHTPQEAAGDPSGAAAATGAGAGVGAGAGATTSSASGGHGAGTGGHDAGTDSTTAAGASVAGSMSAPASAATMPLRLAVAAASPLPVAGASPSAMSSL